MKAACICRLGAVVRALDAYPVRHEPANRTDLKLKSCIENLKRKPTIPNNKEQLISCFLLQSADGCFVQSRIKLDCKKVRNLPDIMSRLHRALEMVF